MRPAPEASAVAADPARPGVAPEAMTHMRAAYMGALAYESWQSHQPVRDFEMHILADMFIRSFHGLQYAISDAANITDLGEDALLALIPRMRNAGLLRRTRAPKITGSLIVTDEIELVPAQRALLAGYFSRFFDRFGLAT